MLILIILASLIPGILAVVQYVENNKKEIESKKNKEAFNSKIDILKIDNSDLKRQLKTLSNDNADLLHQLAETALKLNENVIGSGDLQVELNTTNTSNFNLRFVNNSELVANNTNILIQHHNEM
ncbi:MAG: hypothetical protein M3R72_09540 [Bacteroidota bacterium]|nr:hypothetical protein [Bacteroidota bacterium]